MTEKGVRIFFLQPVRAPQNFTTQLKLPAASCRESSILKVVLFYSNRSLTPQQATGDALAPGFVQQNPPIVKKA